MSLLLASDESRQRGTFQSVVGLTLRTAVLFVYHRSQASEQYHGDGLQVSGRSGAILVDSLFEKIPVHQT